MRMRALCPTAQTLAHAVAAAIVLMNRRRISENLIGHASRRLLVCTHRFRIGRDSSKRALAVDARANAEFAPKDAREVRIRSEPCERRHAQNGQGRRLQKGLGLRNASVDQVMLEAHPMALLKGFRE